MVSAFRGEAAGGGAFERFRALVMADPALHDRLWAETEPVAFAALAVALGGSSGCNFTVENIQQALQEGRRAWIERWLP
jgi:hypothetical protein